jgi:hypothetical protein
MTRRGGGAVTRSVAHSAGAVAGLRLCNFPDIVGGVGVEGGPMDGTEWLERVFAPAVEDGHPQPYVLQHQLRALVDCGVLDARQLAEAERRIEESRLKIEPPGSAAPPPTNRLVRVLAPALPLADIDGVTFVLTSVELWEHSVEVFVAGVPSAVTERRERDASEAFDRWAQERHDGDRPDGPPPDAMRSARLGVLVGLGDNAGTRYEAREASMGGSGRPWRLQARYVPSVPATATHLIVHVNDDDGRPVVSRELPLDTAT